MHYEIDPQFAQHFRNLKQVFMYITDRCNLECDQCIYKPSITHFIQEDIPVQTALALLADFKTLGASKVTFLGGEPTVYGIEKTSRPLLDLISGTKSLGFEYVRLDTNGQFRGSLLHEAEFKLLNEVAFSLDGYSSESNDFLRGKNTFARCVENIREAVRTGYKVSITCCVHKALTRRGDDGQFALHSMIRFAESLGIAQINFHDLFKAGIPMDTWTGDHAPSVPEWAAVYDEIKARMDAGTYGISVRLPQCFVKKQEFERRPEYFGYCPVKLGERVMVHPNGVIRICSNLICTAYGVARYFDRRIEWDRSNCNEARDHKMNENTPCTNRSRHKTYGEYVPLCFSFKPDQDEHVWRRRLDWDSKGN